MQQLRDFYTFFRSKNMICNKCGADIDAASKFCPQCGAAIEDEIKTYPQAVKSPGSAEDSKPVMKRLPFIFWSVVYYAAICFHLGFFKASAGNPYSWTSDSNLKLYLGTSFVMLCLYVYFCVTRRLRDCGMSTGLALLMLFPGVSTIFMLYLFFPKSKPRR